MRELSLEELMKAGIHFGHQTKGWNPKMSRYIFTARNGIHIINLKETQKGYESAAKFLKEVTSNGGRVLFVGTRLQTKSIIKEIAAELNQYFVTERWLGGMLTNIETVRKSIKKLEELRRMSEDGTFDALSKKEVIKLTKQLNKLELNLGGIKEMRKLPDAVYMSDIKKDRIALAEARKLNIPVIALVDTNSDPDGIDYVIPGNDDVARGVELITLGLADAITEGTEIHKIKAAAAAAEQQKQALEKKESEKTDNASKVIAAARKKYLKEQDQKSKESAGLKDDAKSKSAATDETAKEEPTKTGDKTNSSDSEEEHSSEPTAKANINNETK